MTRMLLAASALLAGVTVGQAVEGQAVRGQAVRGQATKPDFAALERAFTKARDDWNVERRAASRAKDKARLAELARSRPRSVFLPRFQKAAAELAGTGAAVPFLGWIVQRGDLASARKALATVMTKHVTSPHLRPAVARLGGLHGRIGLAQTRAWLDTVLTKNEHEDVLMQARFTRALLYVGTRAAEHSEETRQLAIGDLEKVIAGSDKPSLRAMAVRLLHEAKTLEPGLAAPDIAGEDLDGVAFKLSDYRGKVILLDFWGDW